MLPSHTATQPPAESRGGARDRARLRLAERGAVLVHAAFAIAGLLAFAAISIDLGTLWVSRGQVQNAVDAAALAGAADLAYGVAANAPATAQTVAQAHRVWGDPIAAASVPTPLMVPCPARPAGTREPAGECLKVLVERRTSSGTALPVFFARIFGSSAAEVWASAQAGVLLDNATPCPRPFGILDRFFDANGDGIYRVSDGDSYTPPSAGGGWSTANIGESLTKQLFEGPDLATPMRSDQFVPLDLPGRGGTQDDQYRENIQSCGVSPMSLESTYAAFVPLSFQTSYHELDALWNLDPSASWDDGSRSIRNSTVMDPPSPRLITIAVLDPTRDLTDVRVVNLMGLFLDPTVPFELRGVIVPMGGSFLTDDGGRAVPVWPESTTFLRTVSVVR